MKHLWGGNYEHYSISLSNEGNDPALHKAVTELGAWIGQKRKHTGLRWFKKRIDGGISDSVLNAGGRAIGIEPQFLLKRAAARRTDTADRDERYVRTQNKMIELGDAFIAFPGGTGTLEGNHRSDVKSIVEAAGCSLYSL